MNKELARYHDDMRSSALNLHLFVEYCINEIIRIRFDDCQEIFDEKKWGWSFGRKVKLLKCSGVLVEDSILAQNIGVVQDIRNYYSHTLKLASDEVDENIVHFVHEMKPLHERLEMDSWTTLDKFQLLTLETIASLLQLYNEVLKANHVKVSSGKFAKCLKMSVS